MTKYTVTVEDGTTTWFDSHGNYHRDDGPALVWANGDKLWYQHGNRHRDDGPAVERVNGDKYWYKHDEFHRADGPALEYADGTMEWYLNGTELSEDEFNQQVNGCTDKIVTIDGVKYKLTPA
jgi:hypothetical protein